MIAPDDTTFAYLEGRPGAPQGADWERALDEWRALPTRRGRDVRPRARESTSPRSRRRSPGARTPAWSRRSTARVPDPADFDDPDDRAAVERALDVHGARAGHADRATSASTASSSARARTRGSRTCAPRPRSSPGGACTRPCARWSSRARRGVKRQAEEEGLDRVFERGGLRVAPRRLLDVPRHEPRHPRSRASAAPRRRTATSRAARARAAARTSSARRWPPRRRSPGHFVDVRELQRVGVKAFRVVTARRGGARPRRRRHRPDHAEAVPEADRAHRLRRVPLLRLARRTRTSS